MTDKSRSPKGILKKGHHAPDKRGCGIQWDEENVAATFHPVDKDYGHIKINEPPTPYESGSDFDEDSLTPSPNVSFNAVSLSNKLEEVQRKITLINGDRADDEILLPENIGYKYLYNILEHKKEFEKKRKDHYNEFVNVKQARELIKHDLEEIETDPK
uniref:Protein phosphatase inhibitor 2 (Trinotate prediction) n=1 Tax=Myxobolus squamalis TaxID=59785 RepID=A0A6B2G6G9_MYXSQ